jgi:hypothetical protein
MPNKEKEFDDYLEEIGKCTNSEQVSALLELIDEKHSTGELLIMQDQWPELTTTIAMWKKNNT